MTTHSIVLATLSFALPLLGCPMWAAAQASSPETAKPGEAAPSAGSKDRVTEDALDAKVDETSKKAEQAAATAQEAKETANAAAQTAADATSEAKLADLKGGKFIRYGVTAGVAFAVQTQSVAEGTNGAKQLSTAATTMPYVLLVPGYWGLGDVTITYCAAKYAGDPALATDAANTYARKKALAWQSTAVQMAYAKGDDAARKLVEQEAAKYWNPKQPGSCGWTAVGAWVGKPLSFDASVRPIGGESQEKRQVDSTFATGLAYLPNSYVTVLAGISLNSITVSGTPATDAAPATPDRLRRFVSLTFGLGGNLDVVGALFK